MGYTYLNREIRGGYIELSEALDSNYAQGTTYEDYRTGKPAPWIPLSEAQLSFREENPNASIKEVIEMTLDGDRLLREARSVKMSAIRQKRELLRSFKIDGEESYVNSGVRKQALYDASMTSDVLLSGKHYTLSEGRAIVSEMDAYDKEVDEVYNGKMGSVNEAGSIEDVNAIDAEAGYPSAPERSFSEIQSIASSLEGDNPTLMAVRFARKAVNETAIPLSSSEALTLKVLFPIWGEEGAEYGKEVEPGFRLRVVERDSTRLLTSDVLYEVIQTHSLSDAWKPGVDTASLYKVVDVDHAGTEEDPIPYIPPMEIFNGKYYTQDSVKYLCVRDSGIPLSHNLADLVGNYVTAV